MKIRTIDCIRGIFFGVIGLIGYKMSMGVGGVWNGESGYILGIILGVGGLGLCIDMLFRGSTVKFFSTGVLGVGMGILLGWMILQLPFDDIMKKEELYALEWVVYVTSIYLGLTFAYKTRDEFNLVIPYVKLVSKGVDKGKLVVDLTALIDGRIASICATRFFGGCIYVPKFVVEDMQSLLSSVDMGKKNKGQKAFGTYKRLIEMKHVDLRVYEGEIFSFSRNLQHRVVSVAVNLKANLLTLDYGVVQEAEMNGVKCLSLTLLAKSVQVELGVGDVFDVELVKAGKEGTQAVGYLCDGSMVVVNDASNAIGKTVRAEVVSVLPSAGGKMVFAQISSHIHNN